MEQRIACGVWAAFLVLIALCCGPSGAAGATIRLDEINPRTGGLATSRTILSWGASPGHSASLPS